jgi:penicillin-binding protein 1B
MGQIALLAGLVRAPNYYSPHTHPDRALERRNVVLRTLLRANEIDQRTYRAALAEPLGVVPPPPSTQGSPYFVDNVRRELADTFPDDVLTSEGYSVFTTLDPEMQKAAERAVAGGLDRLERDFPFLLEQGGGPLQAALVAINPRTGGILAMVGGRDYRQSQFNRVTDAKRQPGSVFKPIVYLAALSGEVPGGVHYLPTTILQDAPFVWEYDGKEWEPHNYDDEYFGPVTLRHALEHSLNAATASVARDVGIDVVRDMAVRLGINESIRPLPAIALGGWEVSPLEIARAYAVFASGGLATEPISIAKVISREGGLVEGNRIAIRTEISPADAYLITSLLEGVVERGTAQKLRRLGMMDPAAGKTGTTNDYNDAWFAGFTRDVLAVVWVGFDRKAKLGLTGATAALPIWAEFMKSIAASRSGRPFEVPEGISFQDIDRHTGLAAGWGCRDTLREAFLEGEEVLERCTQH